MILETIFIIILCISAVLAWYGLLTGKSKVHDCSTDHGHRGGGK